MSGDNNEVVNEEVSPEQSAIEKEARLLGWVPQTEFRDGDHFVDAEAFVKRGKEINPILRKNNETLLKKLEAANLEIAEVKRVAKEFEAFQKENATRKVADLERQLTELKEQKKAAITGGDGEAVVALDEAIDAVKQEQLDAKKPKEEPKKVDAPVVLDPILVSWMDENKWFTEDKKLTAIADAIGVNINKEYPNLKGKAFLDKLDEELEEVLPERLKKKSRNNPVEGGTTNPTRTRGGSKQSYENLPDDAKAACNKFVKSGLMTKEQYVSEYDWN